MFFFHAKPSFVLCKLASLSTFSKCSPVCLPELIRDVGGGFERITLRSIAVSSNSVVWHCLSVFVSDYYLYCVGASLLVFG